MTTPRKPHIVGRPFPNVAAESKLTGSARFVDDLVFEQEMLHARLVRSNRAHALIKGIDVSRAMALSAVKAVLVGDDVPVCLGFDVEDRPVLAVDRVRYLGEPVAVVVAETPEAAAVAAGMVYVQYEDLPALLDIEQSCRDDANLIHPTLADYPHAAHVHPRPATNIGHHVSLAHGNLDAGWAASDVIVEHTYRVAPIHHVPLEPHGAVAMMDAGGRITLWASTQAPFVQRQTIAQALGLEPDRLRVITPAVGGGFGGKGLVSIEALAVALAMRLPETPVKLVLTRDEDFSSTFRRPGLSATLRAGASRDGVLQAFSASYEWDCGASIDAAIDAAWTAIYAGTGPYRIANVQIDSYCVYTNYVAAGPMRGNGMPEVHWAVEQHIDRLAEALAMDAVAFRLRNALKGGDVIIDNQIMHATGLEKCIRSAARAVRWPSPGKSSGKHRRRGKGVAAMWSPAFSGRRPGSQAVVRLERPGEVAVYIGGVEVGQGLHTVVGQLVAAELSVPLEWVQISHVDTDESPFQWQSGASHLTWSIGNAVIHAAHAVRTALLQAVAEAWSEPIGNLDVVEGVIISYASDRSLPLPQLLESGLVTGDGERAEIPIEGIGQFVPESLSGDSANWPMLPIMHFSTAAQAVEVEVDVETGMIDILHLASAFDVGRAINPDIVASQIKGGAVQGLSITLLESLRQENGRFGNASLRDYRLANSLDVPQKLEAIIIEVPQDDGPFGARGVGEHALVGVSAAVANALYNAVGIRISSLPITSESVWEALQKQIDSDEIIT
ncbi:MAG: xanthine dehydrogenase family protein molybdopterin-binding subunit [Caldilineales bacterium]|nr:xanthine dehydrogenase family protein molybdopterin-binding subunit [Caldilineales bacterium]